MTMGQLSVVVLGLFLVSLAVRLLLVYSRHRNSDAGPERRHLRRGLALLAATALVGVVLWLLAGDSVLVQAGLAAFAVVFLIDTVWPGIRRSLRRRAVGVEEGAG